MSTVIPKIPFSSPPIDLIETFLSEGQRVILGKERQLRLCLCALLCESHILIEDLPGVGKTTLVKTLARLLGLEATRVQFTNDLLPSDILGTSVFDSSTNQFRFHPGPIFGQIVIADELNRATPKTQSALLQAMEERKVTVDGVTHPLPRPFFVVATQNPLEQTGTYPLPESQLDRFLMRIDIGYPDRKAERDLLKGERREILLEELQPAFSVQTLMMAQVSCRQVHISDALINYVQDILDYSRSRPQNFRGLSPRSGLAMIESSRAWAFIHGRKMVLPDDVQAVAPAVMAHRLRFMDRDSSSGESLAREILEHVPVP